MQFESQPLQKPRSLTHDGLVYAVKRTSRISHESDEGYGILQQQWKYLLVVYCPIFHCREATKNLLVDSPQHFDSWPQQKWHDLNYTWFLSAIKCSFLLLMTSNEGYETLQQQ